VTTDGYRICVVNKDRTVDTYLKIRQIDENRITSDIEVGKGSEDNVFVALFDDKDIDFEIVVDNTTNTKDMGFSVTFGKINKFLVERGVCCPFETFETNGYHLRFLSPKLCPNL
jgi:hypothetical protein